MAVRKKAKKTERRQTGDALLKQQLAEASAQQAATAEILRAIARSRTDERPVFKAIVENAHRLCVAGFSILYRYDGKMLHVAADSQSNSKAGAALRSLYPMAPRRDHIVGAAVLGKKEMHTADIRRDKQFPASHSAHAKASGYRAGLVVPLSRTGTVIGALAIGRLEARAFSQSEIRLARSFAAQAVIAIENVRSFNEARESLERQTATAEILRVISRSQTETKSVFEAISVSTMRLFGAWSAAVFSYDGEQLHLESTHGALPDSEQYLRQQYPRRPDADFSLADRCVMENVEFQLADAWSDSNPISRERARARGYRSLLAVPMLRDGASIGVIAVTRKEAGGFTAPEAELLKTFADQAVIAIENVRLFNETRESLERQTATAEILSVIASSPSNVQPVFDTIAVSALRLCEGMFSVVTRFDGNLVHLEALSNVRPEHGETIRGGWPAPAGRTNATTRAIAERRIVQIPDVREDEDYKFAPIAEAVKFRSVLAVPMLRDGEPIGGITVSRAPTGPFSKHQIALLKTFADQAVIAIENVRLFNETKEALERQTATAEILKVISGSPTDTKPVFDAIVRSAVNLCGAEIAAMFPYDGNLVHLGATHNWSEEAIRYFSGVYPAPPSPALMSGRTILAKSIVTIEDATADAHYDPNSALTGHWRRMLGVPMMREGRPLGAIVVCWREPGQTPQRQVDLLQTFADQAVIAIENVRLFNETKEALERQTATAEILRAIASSPSDVQPVFDAIVQTAKRLIGAFSATVTHVGDGMLHLVAHTATTPQGAEALNRFFPIPVEGTPMGRAIQSRRPAFVDDFETEPNIKDADRELARTRGFRSVVFVPLMRGDVAIGSLNITRREAGRMSDHQIGLLKTFADQAVIAIENVRLFKELQSRTEALTKSVGQLTALGEVGQAISSTLDLDTVLQTIVHRAVQLTGLDAGVIYEYDEQADLFLLRASENFDEESVAELRGAAIRKGEGAVGTSAVTREPTQVPDTHAPDYPARLRELLDPSGFRAILAVPLLREENIIGALMVIRKAPGPFAPEIVELLKTFATQSAMAIQNARLFREIAEKGKQLEIASRHKSDFLANMSHELRTPLNAIIGFSEVLIERMFGELNEKQADYMKDIHESGRHLLSLINDILDLSKIEAGRMDLDIAAFDLPSALANAMTLVRERAQRQGIALGLEVDPALGEIRADERKFKQILLNLLSNAVKFTPRGGRVDVLAAQRAGAVQIAVKDSGIGIAPEDHAAVFEEFKQVGSDYTRKSEGTGLGLALTRRFVELHGGEIRLESEPGKGSIFTFTLPVRT